MLFLFGIPGHIDDSLTWIRWFKANSQVSLTILSILALFGVSMTISELWIPYTANQRRLRRLAPLLKEFLDETPWTYDEQTNSYTPSDTNPNTLVFKWGLLEQELHTLKIRHRNLLFRPSGWAHFSERLLKAAWAGDLREARKAGEWWTRFSYKKDVVNQGVAPGTGTYECTYCGWYVTLDADTEQLPACERCTYEGLNQYQKV